MAEGPSHAFVPLGGLSGPPLSPCVENKGFQHHSWGVLGAVHLYGGRG